MPRLWWIAGAALCGLVGCAEVFGIEAATVRGSGGAGGTATNGGGPGTGGDGGDGAGGTGTGSAVACTGNNYAEVVMGDQPEAYWRFEETAGGNNTAASDANPTQYFGNYGTGAIVDAGPTVTGSNSAVGLMIANDSLVNFGPVFDFTHEDEFSIELWIALGAGVGEKHLFGRRANQRGFVLMHDSTELQFFFQYGGARIGPVALLMPGTAHHIVVTNTPDTTCIYRDGTEIDCVPIEATVADPEGNLSIGANGFYFQGVVDEAAVYLYALSQEKIRDHYECGKPEGV